MESKGKLCLDTPTHPSNSSTQPASRIVENQGSGDFSSQDGSLPSSSSTSSERNHAIDCAEDVSTLLKDEEVRAMLKKVTVNESVLNKAIQSLGGGEKGLKSLMGYIMFWVKQQRESKSSSQQPAPPPSNPASHFSTAGDVVPQSNSDAIQILSSILQPPSATQVPNQDVHPFQRFKSRRLMMGESEMDAGLGGLDTGFCPSNFISTPEDYKPEMASPAVMTPCIPQLNYGMQQQQPVIPFTTAHIAMPCVEPTLAMTSKAARRHRMARQRQSFHARAASQAAINTASAGGGSTWKNAAALPLVKISGMPGARCAPQVAPATASRKSRNMESLTLLLQKELRPSDVGNLGRIIIPKKEAEQCMPSLASRGGLSIQMEDFDSGHAWNLRYRPFPISRDWHQVLFPYPGVRRVLHGVPLALGFLSRADERFWPNNKSRMYLLENTGDFVKSHGLVEGDLILIYRVQQGGYVLRGMKKKTKRLDIEPAQVKFAYSSAQGSLEEPTSQKENGMLVQRLYGGGPSDKGVKEEPVTLDDDSFLKEMVQSMGLSFGSDSICLETLERFPSLNLDFPLEEIMAASKTEPEG